MVNFYKLSYLLKSAFSPYKSYILSVFSGIYREQSIIVVDLHTLLYYLLSNGASLILLSPLQEDSIVLPGCPKHSLFILKM